MIELDRFAFCGLSTSNSWQRWLYEHDVELYKQFTADMRENRSCEQNRRTMERYLQIVISRHELVNDFINFIKTNYPFIIKRQTDESKNHELDHLFTSNVLTFPRRVIIYGNLYDFTHNKLKYEAFFDGSKYYVEYLEKEDISFVDDIADHKWILPKYKARRQEYVKEDISLG